MKRRNLMILILLLSAGILAVLCIIYATVALLMRDIYQFLDNNQ